MRSRYSHLTEEIARLTAAYHRPAGAVRLVAVSKRHSVDKVVELARLGQRDMAENYLQEGVEKIRAVGQEIDKPLCWHFIGHIQSRKCRLIAEHFSWVHTVDSLKVANKLNHARAEAKTEARAETTNSDPLQVFIQLNLHGEASKSGVSEAELPALAEAVAELPNLRLRGLMIIPKIEKTLEKQRIVFRRCRELRDELNARGFDLDHLSMGMSDDLEAAIAEGATMVRIGTAVFGPRPANQPSGLVG